MIRELLDKLTGRRKSRFGKRVEIGPATHRIDLSLVDGRAISVVSTLKNAGYEAYIVGGAVRDLLLGLRPKDFDVATNATPEQVKALFRRAFIIGRRFRIVHVVFGRGRERDRHGGTAADLARDGDRAALQRGRIGHQGHGGGNQQAVAGRVGEHPAYGDRRLEDAGPHRDGAEGQAGDGAEGGDADRPSQ